MHQRINALLRRVILPLFLAGLSIACQTQPTFSNSNSSNGDVFARFSPSPDTKWSYRLATTCKESQYSVRVELLESNTVASFSELEGVAESDTVKSVDIDDSFGATDPLDYYSALSAWRIGSEEKGIGVVARLVQLAPRQWGLLITQVVGFDHVKRNHMLFFHDERKLRRVWTQKEGAGPTWSAVFLGESKKQQIIFHFKGFQPDFGNEPDQLSLDAYVWDTEHKKLIAAKSPELWGVIAGSFNSAAEARSTRLENGECYYAYWVLPAKRFEAKSAGGFVLAALSTSRQLAEAAGKKAAQCARGITVTRATAR